MDLRVSVNLVWDISAPSLVDGKNQAGILLKKMIGDKPIRRSIHVCERKVHKKQGRLGTFRPEEILPFVTKSSKRQEFRIDGKIYNVKMNSHRYHVFAKDLKCASCGLVGSIIALETSPGSEHPHFNLYALDGGSEVLMTKDHIIPVAQGGPDAYENYAVLCSICNNIKADTNINYKQLKSLRKIYNQNRHKLSCRDLNALIKKEMNTILAKKT